MNGNIPQQVKQIVKETTSELRKIYQTHLKDVIVFGSYARGDFTEDSDIDLCILLDDMQSVVSEREKYSSVISTLCLKYDVVISIIPCQVQTFYTKRTPLLLNVNREGIRL